MDSVDHGFGMGNRLSGTEQGGQEPASISFEPLGKV